ncbi:serine/threonine-protein kinase EDR1-like isoform X6 [Olea europaea var. sylvestris]|uniref:serine/threonine-protein kinase EDR1-like isoform X6 n=1 Tax=Olea europaea var. sylvestris TaxID=158386 RepID=UPI000C1D11C7|nr:serine/threonine-protein kinase EDR1-like isoform X6 [Olea europaea var. sylvestris]
MIPEIGDDTVSSTCFFGSHNIDGELESRAFRTMNQTPRRNRPPKEQVNFTQRSTSETDDSSDLQESLSRFNPENHMKYSVHGKQKAISLPSPPQCFGNQASLRDKASTISASPDMMSIFNKVLGTSKILKKPLLPFQEWNIDFSEITIGARVGIGFFGEVFCGTWNGLEVGIKVFLEQELTVENVEDFFNEISILSRIRHPNVILFLGACTKPPRLSLVTEYMEMGSLYYLIHVSGLKKKLSWKRRVKMLCDICRFTQIPSSLSVLHCTLSCVLGFRDSGHLIYLMLVAKEKGKMMMPWQSCRIRWGTCCVQPIKFTSNYART